MIKKTLSLIILQKMLKHALERMPWVWLDKFVKEIGCVTDGYDQPSQ